MTAYDSVLIIAKNYLGPAAESFLARQCQVGLQVEASKITTAHLKNLAATVEVAACRFPSSEAKPRIWPNASPRCGEFSGVPTIANKTGRASSASGPEAA